MKHIYFLILITLPFVSPAQFRFNANFQNLKFGGPGVTIVNKVGNGSTAGSVVLYQNVVNIGGQQIDAIIRTKSISAGAIMLLDQQGTGVGYTNNNPTWFSPQFYFPGAGGSAVFNFEFILGGSYNNTTKTGTTVTLENITINSYDIDGNDSLNSNQYSEFGGFSRSELSTTTSLLTSYNPATNLTRFSSSIVSNVVNAADPNTRVRVTYNELDNFEIAVGAGAAGVAYFFIDFDMGPVFTTPTVITTAPTLDLNTNTPGSANSATHCTVAAVSFTQGSSNVGSVISTPSGGTAIERVRLVIPTNQLLNGSDEKLIIKSASSGGSIALNFANAAAITSVKLKGVTYAVTATVAGGENSLSFMKSGSSTMELKDAENLVDAFTYSNTAASPAAGNRVFEVRVKDGAYESWPAYYTIGVDRPATIITQVKDTSITVGSNTVFSVVANAASYQWQVDPGTGIYSNITDSDIYSGANTNTLTLTNVPLSMNSYKYRVITGNICAVNSSIASLSVLMILPVTWASFDATNDDKNISLKWITSNEINTKKFIVQHSVDGRSFGSIGSVSAAGTSSGKMAYNYVHTAPASGINYYRILQVDADGRTAFSKVISIRKGSDESISIMTNPVAHGNLVVQTKNATTLALFNAEGKMVKVQRVNAGQHTMQVSSLARGMYTLLAGNQAHRVLVTN